jgi:hypothetical protein
VSGLLFVLALFLNTSSAHADPFGGIAVAVGLSVLGDKVNEAVEKAIGGGLVLEVQAGGQVSVAIQQAKAIYDQESAKFWNDLQSNEQATLNSLVKVANDFIDKTYSDLKDIEARANGIVHNLPFTKEFPQLWKYSPSYVEQIPGGKLRLALEGDFIDVMREGFDASINIAGKSFQNVDKSNSNISFELPLSVLSAASDNQVGSNHISITIPYREQYLMFFHTKKVASLTLPLMVLPKKFGTVSFDITTVTAGTASQTTYSPEFMQESGDDDIKCGGEHGDLAVHIAYPDSGWTVVPSSVTWNVTWSQGNQGVDQDWWLAANCSSPTAACLCVSTEHHGWGTSGKVHFRIAFTEQKPINNVASTNSTVDVGWGESRIVDLPPGAQWKGTYTRFDGKQFQFNGNYKDQYVTISQLGSGITVRTAPYDSFDMKAMLQSLTKLNLKFD